MKIKVRCQQCGRTSQFSESDAGLTALCVACGGRFVIPRPQEVIADSDLKDAPARDVLAAFLAAQPITLSADGAKGDAPAENREQAALPTVQAAWMPQRQANYAMLYGLMGLAILAAITIAVGAALALKGKHVDSIAAATGARVKTNVPNAALQAVHPTARATHPTTTAALEPAPRTIVTPAAGPSDEAMTRDWPEYHPQALATRPTAVRPVTPRNPLAANLPDKPPAGTMPEKPTTSTSRPATAPAAPDIARRTGPEVIRPAIHVRLRPENITDEVTDAMIGRAIEKGVYNLLSQFRDGAIVSEEFNRRGAYETGLDALCVYALLQSSYAIKDERLNLKGPFIRKAIDKLKAMPADRGPVTYARALRASALALLNRTQDKTALKADVNYLIHSQVNGAYTYQAQRRSSSAGNERWDNSNSQYGLLGVWSGAEVGIEVNSTYWAAVEKHWTRCQLDNGSWEYAGYNREGEGRLSMSVAGCASLFVTHDWLDAPRMGTLVGRPPFSKALSKGLDYLESGNHAISMEGGYSLYGLERVGLASGFKFFGEHDWYRELAARIVRGQSADGSWGSNIETAYHLLFLARGRHPILMNKLRYDGYWANRPRDVANLARFGSAELERPLNWQVVPITRDWTDWMDSPVLYMASHVAVNLSEEDIGKIRSFVEAGGMLFTQADGGMPEGDAWAHRLAKRLFPKYEMKKLSDQHEIYSVLYKPAAHPVLFGVSNGSRLLMVHSPNDISQHWQMRQEKSRRAFFEMGINLFLYASGKADLRNRLTSSYIPPLGPAGGGSIRVLRMRYPGNWDPEPGAWERFSRYFQKATDVEVRSLSLDLDKLDPSLGGFAHWTGTDAYTATPAQIAAIRGFVKAGGVLLIDPCGGSGDFYESAKLALLKAFPDARPQFIPRGHPMLAAGTQGMEDVAAPQVRPYVKSKKIGTGRLDYIDFGKGKVILSPLDITTGLTSNNSWGVLGYDPNYASALLKNLLLWSATGMREE